MKLDEINSLIAIRSYASLAVNTGSNSKETVRYMNNILMLIDRKINDLLSSDEFKEYISYKDMNKVIQEVREITNIKSGLK